MADHERACTDIREKCKNKGSIELKNIFKEIIDKRDSECTPLERAIKCLKNWKCSEAVNVCDQYDLMNIIDVEMQDGDDAPDSPQSTPVRPSSPKKTIPVRPSSPKKPIPVRPSSPKKPLPARPDSPKKSIPGRPPARRYKVK